MKKGVRQGGILSAYFFAVYMDLLCERLNNCRMGCEIAGLTINNLIYADDVCLIATTTKAINSLLAICDSYALEHRLTFNPVKTHVQTFFPKWLNQCDIIPQISFKGTSLSCESSVLYLGCLIEKITKYDHDRLSDNKEIARRVRDLYKKSNMIKAKFSNCSREVKSYLFRSYLSTIYCSSLWDLTKADHHKIMVAYNDALRIICGFRRDFGVIEMFTECKIRNFNEMLEHAAKSITNRLLCSSNSFIKCISYSSWFSPPGLTSSNNNNNIAD